MLQGLQAFVEGRLERRFNAPRADLDVQNAFFRSRSQVLIAAFTILCLGSVL
jgi:hypothetical protein